MGIELALLPRPCYRGREITGSRLPSLLALLAGDLRAGCGTARLVAELWPDEQPEHPVKALQVLVARARALLGPDLILSTSTGYRLALGEEQVDAAAVLLSASATERSARAGDNLSALRHAEEGLALCGPATGWDAAPDDPLSALRLARLPAYRALIRARALSLARTGRRAEAVEPLGELAAQRPRDEELLVELLRCEAATIGPAAALTRFDAYRQALREELGADPGPALQRVHRELLLSDAPTVRHGVRLEPNPLLGRDKDIAAVTDLLQASRVTSIVGAGGLGKTRLAHAVGRQAPQRAVYFVELAGVTADGDIAGEVASALGVREAGSIGRLAAPADVLTGIAKVLGAGPTLLVLDNCEHVLHPAAELVRDLVSSIQDLRVLATSRAPLGLSSESVYRLPELDLPTMVELFGQRARAARAEVELPPTALRNLCTRLDGSPLAVELAAARVRVMSVAEIARRLADRFALLQGGARDAPQRHHTLYAVIDWSWHLLAPAGQQAMRALSVFPGGFTAAAAGHLVGDDAVLEHLVDQSLLKVADSESGTRFRMLETVREFSVLRRAAAGETDRVLGRFLAWATDFGVRQHETVFADDLATAMGTIRAEEDNLLYALRSGLDREDGAAVVATAALLGTLWLTDSNFARLATLAEDAPWVLSHFRPQPALVEATRTTASLCALSAFLLRGPRPLRAMVTLRRLPPPATDTVIGAVQMALSAPDIRALRELCGSDRPMVAAIANYALSSALENANDLSGALQAARRMLDVLGGGATPWLRAVAHARIGEFCLQVEPGEEALHHLDAALSITEDFGASATATRARWAIVLANLQRGAFDAAERGLAEIAQDGTDGVVGLAMFDVCAQAEILLGRGDVDRGLRLWREAAGRLRTDDPAHTGWWAWEVRTVAVVTHARFGRLDLVTEITGTLPVALPAMIASASVVDFPGCGSLLLALAVTDLDSGETTSGVRMIALAERFGWPRGFQPTMSTTRITEIAEKADPRAYAKWVLSFAGLDHEGLRGTALAWLRARDQLTGPDPAGTAPAPTDNRSAPAPHTRRRR